MACWQVDDKPSPELILKSMTPYHVNGAQKSWDSALRDITTAHTPLQSKLVEYYPSWQQAPVVQWSNMDPASCGNAYQMDVEITLVRGPLWCGIM